MQETRLSVAVVTRNRPSSLERTLQSLRGQSVQPFEVIVSDDSDEEHVNRVREIIAAHSCHYVRGPRRGLYANRNHVAAACTGTHVRTMDDDHEFPSEHMSRCLSAITSDPTAVWIIGEYLGGQEHPDAPPECPGQLNPRGFSVAPPDPDNSWAISDGATIYPREIFDRGLRFAERFRFGAAYLEFGSRLAFLGYRIRQLRSTYVIHHYEALKRSVIDPEGEMTAEIFAMLCHSFIYHPSLTNRMQSIGQISLMIIRSGKPAFTAFRNALNEYRLQSQAVAKFAR